MSVIGLIVFCLAAAAADPQQVAAPAPAVLEFSAGVERRLDRFRYRFENDSNFDTAELVEHFFQQRYDAHHNWLVARAGYQRPQRRRGRSRPG